MGKKQSQSFLLVASLQIDLDVREVNFLQKNMVQFEEVLGHVRLALTWATPAEIRALLKGLVEQGIISEAYSRSLSLHGLTEGITPDWIHNETPCVPGSIQDHSLANLESILLIEESWTNVHPLDGGQVKHKQEGCWDEHYLSHIRATSSLCGTQSCLDDEMPELLRSAEPTQKLTSDSERVKEGISADEREWLEQVEEAARRIAVPLWQHWDRGQKMLLPMLPSTPTDYRTSENSATHAGEQCPLLKIEEEIELVVACRSLGLYTDNFREANADTMDAGKATWTPGDLCFCPDGDTALPGLNMDLLRFLGRAGSASPGADCMATNTNSDVADVWDDSLPTPEDMLHWGTDVHCGAEDGFREVEELLSPFTPKDTFTHAPDNPFDATTRHSVTPDITENKEKVPSTSVSSTDAMPASPDGTEGEERLESHWRKFLFEYYLWINVLLWLLLLFLFHLHEMSAFIGKLLMSCFYLPSPSEMHFVWPRFLGVFQAHAVSLQAWCGE